MSGGDAPALTGNGAVLGAGVTKVALRTQRGTVLEAIRSCRSGSMVIDGIRSTSEPGVAWSLYLVPAASSLKIDKNHPGYVGDLNFFGTARLGPRGRKMSFPLGQAVLSSMAAAPSGRVELRLVPTGRSRVQSGPTFSKVQLWCLAGP